MTTNHDGSLAPLTASGTTASSDEPIDSPQRRWWLASLWAVSSLIVLALVIVIAAMGYPAWMISVGRSRAEALCAAATVGKSVAKIQTKAHESGLTIVSAPARTGPDGKVLPAQIIGMGGWSFARWFCMIEHADGRILNKRVDVLD
jgi:hypothetical protein